MGCSVKVIDDTYGHLARDSEQAIREGLDARGNAEPQEAGRDSARRRGERGLWQPILGSGGES
jgi:hypothetical protein